ncbi:MAG: acetate uptake transporter family protein [Bacillota bacterium]
MENKPSFANPTPAGLVALAVACFCFFAMLTGKVQTSASILIGCWLIGGFVIQVIVGLIDLKNHNTSGGNAFLYFSAFFMLVSGIEMITKFILANAGIAFDATIDGWAWAALTLATFLWTPAFFKAPLPLTLIVLFLDVALPFISLMDMKVLSHDFAVIPAVSLLLSGITAIYFSGAIVVNTAFGKSVLPIPKPIIK